MASSSQGLRTGIQVVLAIIIIGLAYVLYQSITEPYDRIQRQQQLTEQTRQRMSAIRTALIEYERDSTTYPDSLELLLAHVQRDSALQVEYDSLLGANFTLDSLLHSPRTGSRFLYTVNDTGRVETYLLEDPDSEDQIGTLSGDVTQTNSANWE